MSKLFLKPKDIRERTGWGSEGKGNPRREGGREFVFKYFLHP